MMSSRSSGVLMQRETATYTSTKCGKSRKAYHSRRPSTVSAGRETPFRSASLSTVSGRMEPSRWT